VIARVTRVLAIPNKREDQQLIGYLTRPEIQALVAAPDQSKWVGRRDHALLLTLYNSGARVSEITMLKRDQVCFSDSTFLQLFGKGRKERTIPLWAETVQVLRAWFHELGEHTPNIAFPSVRGKSLSRDGVDYLLKRAVQRAVVDCRSLTTKKISPHIIRHTTAMHLLQAGVDIATIALWLGHESIETTHVYLQADLAMKEEALGKLEPIDGAWQRFRAEDPLLAFLASL
jgi:integrase/recombinase XerD